MLTRWLTFTALLAGSANQQTAAADQGTVTIAPTCRVKGQPEEELTLNCGDGENAGVVQYWHTPFGDLQTPGLHSKLDPVFMHHDGSLVVPNSSRLHSGLYYCVLRHTEGTTLWPYQLYIGYNNQKSQEHNEYEQGSSCDTVRLRRDVGPEGDEQAGVSDGHFAGAVAASVLLTFVFGFSAGALTRAHVLRCLGAVTTRVRSLRQQQRQTDTLDHGSEITMTTVPPMYDNEAFEMGQVQDYPSPPAKPQRSFRHKREEHQETTAYLEGCDYTKEEEKRLEEEDGGRTLEEKSKGEGEAEEEVENEREFSGLYLLGEGGGGQTETDEDKYSEDGEEKDGRESKEDNKESGEEEETDEPENRSWEDGEERRNEDEAGGDKEKGSDEKREEEEGWKEEKEGADGEKKGEEDSCGDSQQSSTETDDEEMGSKEQEDTEKNGIMGGEEARSSPPCPARRSRVIRLYQYDEDGQRYCHLPDPTTDDPVPPPRLKQRSVSLTRLNAIMAAASSGPLCTRETGGEEREERQTFQMDI